MVAPCEKATALGAVHVFHCRVDPRVELVAVFGTGDPHEPQSQGPGNWSEGITEPPDAFVLRCALEDSRVDLLEPVQDDDVASVGRPDDDLLLVRLGVGPVFDPGRIRSGGLLSAGHGRRVDTAGVGRERARDGPGLLPAEVGDPRPGDFGVDDALLVRLRLPVAHEGHRHRAGRDDSDDEGEDGREGRSDDCRDLPGQRCVHPMLHLCGRVNRITVHNCRSVLYYASNAMRSVNQV